MTPYAFRPATLADLPMLRRWLATPEVVRWWGEPGHEAALLEEDLAAAARIGGTLRIGPRPAEQMVQRIVSFQHRPFAYVQDYDVSAWPQDHLAALPEGARAVDAFIGEPDMIGHGHGSAFLRLLAHRLIDEGAP